MYHCRINRRPSLVSLFRYLGYETNTETFEPSENRTKSPNVPAVEALERIRAERLPLEELSLNTVMSAASLELVDESVALLAEGDPDPKP